MGLRRKGREVALQTLYLCDLGLSDPTAMAAKFAEENGLDGKTKQFSLDLVRGTLDHKDKLDRLIMDTSRNWELKRMATIDRNLLRLSAFELLYKLDTPVSVIIDEAVEIAKTFSTPDSGKFVNGILDKIKIQRKNEFENVKRR